MIRLPNMALELRTEIHYVQDSLARLGAGFGSAVLTYMVFRLRREHPLCSHRGLYCEIQVNLKWYHEKSSLNALHLKTFLFMRQL